MGVFHFSGSVGLFPEVGRAVIRDCGLRVVVGRNGSEEHFAEREADTEPKFAVVADFVIDLLDVGDHLRLVAA